MLKLFLKKLNIHPRTWLDSIFTYSKFIGSIKQGLMSGADDERRVRLESLDTRWRKSKINVPLGKRLVVISPHPDDESIGAGGLLLAHRDKAEVHIINIFNSQRGGELEHGPWKETAEYQDALVLTRRKELEIVSRILGVSSTQYLGLKDRESIFDTDTAVRLKQMVNHLQPDIVLIPWFLDNHQDHQAANMLYAWSCSNMSCMVFGFEIWSLCTPNAIFDITDYLEEKIALVQHYKSQIRTVDYVNYLKGLAYVRAFQCEVGKKRDGAAEAFFALPNQDYCDLVRSLYGTPKNPSPAGQKIFKNKRAL